MMLNKITRQTQFAAVFLIVLFSYLTACEGLIRTQTDNYASLFYASDDFTLVEFIVVINDKNFTDYGFPGSGSKEDPFIIENKVIPKYSYHNGIVIINTTKHFIVRGCTTSAIWSAIYLENVADGTAVIQNNICLSSETGITVVGSRNVTILDNRCEGNDFGVFMFKSNFSTITNNTCTRSVVNGIRSQWSSFNVISHNNCYQNFNVGIEVYHDHNVTVSYNRCNNKNVRGVYIQATNLHLTDNLLSSNYEYGACLYNVHTSLIKNNLFSFNGKRGCKMVNSTNNDVINNIFTNNTFYGISLDKDCSNNNIHHNSFIGNNLEGTSQALDDGKNNLWYDEETKEGNFWDGWTSRKPYPIAGEAEAEDKYPLNSTLVRLNFQFLSFGSLFFLVFVFLYRKRRKIFNK
ncbi:MAG: right-handed parallel beta-helix repeat-containing protein [Candidatus Heimdallarchaeaceae archaeon]